MIRGKIRETWEPEMRQQIQLKLDEEMHAGLWNKERDSMKAQLAKLRSSSHIPFGRTPSSPPASPPTPSWLIYI